MCLLAPAISVADDTILTSRPAVDGEPTVVRVSMILIDVDEISSADQNFAANFFYEVRWRDPRLAHDGKDDIVKPLDEVWNPRIQIVNQQRLIKTIAENVDISPDGDVAYRQRVWGHFSQPLDLRQFPLDTQTFQIQLVSARYGSHEVKLIRDPDSPSGIARKFSLADWDVLSWDVQPRLFSVMEGGPEVEIMVMSLEVRRQIEYFVMKIILPLIFIVAMSWICFWIHPTESGTQFSVAVTSMLTLIAYRFAIDTTLPKISYMTRMDYFIFLATVLVFLTLIEVLITAGLAKSQGNIDMAERMDKWSRIVFPVAFVILSWAAFYTDW
jgi:hypothetical protein